MAVSQPFILPASASSTPQLVTFHFPMQFLHNYFITWDSPQIRLEDNKESPTMYYMHKEVHLLKKEGDVQIHTSNLLSTSLYTPIPFQKIGTKEEKGRKQPKKPNLFLFPYKIFARCPFSCHPCQAIYLFHSLLAKYPLILL